MSDAAAAPQQLILHAEDDEMDARMVARAFTKIGCPVQIERAVDGRESIEKLDAIAEGKSPMPALILLDLKLPYFTGIEVLKHARANPSLQDLPIVILTSSDGEDDRRHAQEAGATDYVVKPIEYDAFISTVKGICTRYLACPR